MPASRFGIVKLTDVNSEVFAEILEVSNATSYDAADTPVKRSLKGHRGKGHLRPMYRGMSFCRVNLLKPRDGFAVAISPHVGKPLGGL